MKSHEQLRTAIRSLYDTFSRYAKPRRIDYCPCGCTKPEAVLPLLAVPLHELAFADLEGYSVSAMTTQGSLADFKYFLPRMLEGIASETYGLNPEMLFGKLRFGKWLQWEEGEVIAVRRYLRAIWQVGLHTFPVSEALPEFGEIETLISSIASTGESLDAYLNVWSNSPNEVTDRHLIQFVTQYGQDFEQGNTVSFGFWKDQQEQAQELRRWLLNPSTLSRIENSAHLLPNDGYEHLFNPALQVIRTESAAS